MAYSPEKRQVFGAVEKPIKDGLREVKRLDRRCSEAWVIEQALREYLPKLKKQLSHPPTPPRKRPR